MKISATGSGFRNSNYFFADRNIKSNIKVNNNFSYSTGGLDAFGLYNMQRISFKSAQKTDKTFKLNYSIDELEKRISPEAFTEYRMLDINSFQYKNLEKGDKEALKHLVKAAQILDSVYLRQDNIHNLEFEKFLQKECSKGNPKAMLTKELFEAQKGIIGKSVDGKSVVLAQGIESKPGKGFYPEDLTVDEFHRIITNMLNVGEEDEVRKILNQRTMVLRDGNKLKAVDYTEYFKKQFSAAAEELEKACYCTTNDDFAIYLKYQADALLNNDPELDSMADMKWAKLQDTPLEFTLGRESYDDSMTPTISENKKLTELLKKHCITPYAKDSIGVRVGIVNKEGTDYVLKTKESLSLMADNMPYNDEYEQAISSESSDKQTMVDVDIVAMTGQFGRFRGAISLASNLPNNDKLSVQKGGGKRNVYHIQCRNAKYSDNIDKVLEALVIKPQQKYFDVEALHDFTILHENVHSLGPKNGLESLGGFKNTIEEHKADMGALVMLDLLTKNGLYTPFQQKQIITSYLTAYVMKGPDFSSAHRARNILQHNYFIKHGAIEVTKDGKMKIDFDKVVECSREMLENAVRIQLDRNPLKAETYINDNAVWSNELDKLAQNLKAADKRLNSYVTMPLADKLVHE